MSKSKMEQNLESCLQSVKEFHSLSNPGKIIEYAKKELKLVHPFKITPQFINDYLYRVRTQESMQCDEDLLKSSSFSYVPKELNQEGRPSMGRFNQQGESIFYASLYGTTNLKEMKDEIKEGDIVYLSKWKIKDDTPIRLYYIYPPDVTQDKPFLNSDFHPLLLENLKEIGGILLDKEEEQNKYLKSSLMGNQIFNFKEKGVSFDAILYPSVLGNKYEYNLAIKPEYVDANMELQCVYEAVVKDNRVSIDCSHIGINVNNKVEWYEFYIKDEDIVTSLSFIDKDNNPIMVYEDSTVNYNNTEYTIKDFSSYLSKELLIPNEVLHKNGFFHEGKIEIEDALTQIDTPRVKYYDIKLQGLKLCTQNFYVVKSLRIEVSYKNTLKSITPKLKLTDSCLL